MSSQREAGLRNLFAAITFASVAVLATACGSQVAASGPSASGTEATTVAAEATQANERRIQLAEEAVRNGKYELPGIGTFQLRDGNYQEKYGEGATQVKRVGVVTVAFGQIDGNKIEDAAVVLWANTGGSGTFMYLAPILDQDGKPQQAGAQLLGDRVQIKTLAVESGKIVVTVLSQSPQDPMVSPSLQSVQEYGLQGSTLVNLTPAAPTAPAAPRPTQQPTAQPSQVAPSGLVGTTWTWQRFVDSEEKDSFLIPYPAAYRLELLSDGKYLVQADCNTGSGSYVLEKSRLDLNAGPMSQAECKTGSRSSQFIAMLGQVATYELQADVLRLNLEMDGGDLVFSKLYSVTGRIAGPAGETLPEGATAEIMVVNGAGSQIGGSLVKAQFPMQFEAPFKPANIDPSAKYTLQVTIKDGQKNVIFKSTPDYPVVTQGNPTYHLEVEVARAR
ncbi:MAG: META domain-containing protein [Chloroflexota bacterium]